MQTVRQLRVAAGLTQLQVAVQLGVTPTTVYLWERGVREPRARQLQQLAKLFEVSADDIAIPEPPDEAYRGKGAA